MGGNKALLTTGKVEHVIMKLTLPMIFGNLGMVIFNLVDTYFIAKLGTQQLAALSFTFPVVLVVNSLALGLGVATSSLVSKAVGEGNHYKVKRLGTDSILLSLLLVILFVLFGLATIEPVFQMLGATSEIMPYIKEYMSIWYLGVIFVVVPMVGNSILRALGNTTVPGIIMLVAALLNTVLDPLMIFGYGPFPRLGITGAAVATVIARALTFSVAIFVLVKREKVLLLKFVSIQEVLDSWKVILYIGIPNAFTRMITPIAFGIITKLIASYGTAAVAGYGVSTRLEFFALILVNALSTIMAPFTGQNYGAKESARLKSGILFGHKVALLSGLLMYITLAIFAKPLAQLFNGDLAVVSVITTYLWIVPIGYGMQGILLISSAVLNALNKPFLSSFLVFTQLFVLYLPLALLGSKLFGMKGIFFALVISYFIAGCLAYGTVKKQLFLAFEEKAETT